MDIITRFLCETKVGDFSQSPLLSIYVYDNDNGAIPHFHVFSKDKKIDTCIEIENNRYFRHDTHRSLITDNKVRKQLNDFLHSKPTDLEFRIYPTIWHVIKYLWNRKERIIKVREYTKIPDYKYIYPEIKNDPRLKNSKHK